MIYFNVQDIFNNANKLTLAEKSNWRRSNSVIINNITLIFGIEEVTRHFPILLEYSNETPLFRKVKDI